ncbi:MAG: TadE/TadG family type IV pilus assembly protein [Kiritimatiellae bacterium]|nr:TadE/TadG family type IV pilus assembly protein [Kiritimatiellia bacterium]
MKAQTPHRLARALALPRTPSARSRGGQAMVESVFVMILACLVFFALFQYADLFTAKVVLSHAAARAARSRAVGFNRWMVEKSARAAAIPASGRRLTPPAAGPSAAMSVFRGRPGEAWDAALRHNFRARSVALESSRVPDYMDSLNGPTSRNILDYERWDALAVELTESLNIDGAAPAGLSVTVRQRHPLLLSLARLFEGEMQDADGERLSLKSSFHIESHYPLYMEDMNW